MVDGVPKASLREIARGRVRDGEMRGAKNYLINLKI